MPSYTDKLTFKIKDTNRHRLDNTEPDARTHFVITGFDVAKPLATQSVPVGSFSSFLLPSWFTPRSLPSSIPRLILSGSKERPSPSTPPLCLDKRKVTIFE